MTEKKETRAKSSPTEDRSEDLSKVNVAKQTAKEQEEAARGNVTNVSADPGKSVTEMTPKEYADRFKTVQKYLRENAPETAPAGGTKEKSDDSSE